MAAGLRKNVPRTLHADAACVRCDGDSDPALGPQEFGGVLDGCSANGATLLLPSAGVAYATHAHVAAWFGHDVPRTLHANAACVRGWWGLGGLGAGGVGGGWRVSLRGSVVGVVGACLRGAVVGVVEGGLRRHGAHLSERKLRLGLGRAAQRPRACCGTGRPT